MTAFTADDSSINAKTTETTPKGRNYLPSQRTLQAPSDGLSAIRRKIPDKLNVTVLRKHSGNTTPRYHKAEAGAPTRSGDRNVVKYVAN